MRSNQPLTAVEVGEQLQQNWDQWLQTTSRWWDVLTVDSRPQTGCTPHDIIWRKNKSRLYRYHNTEPLKHRLPVFIVYALINKPYILDLLPGMSLIEYLVGAGFDVYMLDWGEFEWEDRGLSFAELVLDYIAPAVERVCRHSETRDLTMIGYCMGGTMATMYTALFPTPPVKNLIYIATPVDFRNAGVSSIWLQPPGFDAERIAETFQLIPREFIDLGTRMLNPINNYLGNYTRLWKTLDDGLSVQSWKALNKWMDDGINFPGAAYRQWIKELYQENQLIKNQMVLRGRRIDLTRVTANLLALTGSKDHIVLPQQTSAALDYLGSQDKTYREFPVGHGGLVFGAIALKEVFPVLADWLAHHS